MDFFTNNKIVRWLLLVLFIINISALITIAYKGFRAPPPPPPHPPGAPPGMGSEFPDLSRFIKVEMDFNDEQKEKFNNLRTGYFENSKPRMDGIRESKLKIIDELTKDSPDRNLIDTESENSGRLLTEVERLNADFFISAYAICNESQKKKLQMFLKNLNIQRPPDNLSPPPPVF